MECIFIKFAGTIHCFKQCGHGYRSFSVGSFFLNRPGGISGFFNRQD